MTAASGTLLRLDNVYCHGGTVVSKEPLMVETSPQQWDYAISVPLVLTKDAPSLRDLPVRVSTRVRVVSGELGCLLVGSDWTTLAGPAPPTVGEGTHTVDLSWERVGEQANLVFRNHGADNRSCVFLLESVQISSSASDPFVASQDPEQFAADDREVFDYLRRKWSVVPSGLSGRIGTTSVKQMPSDGLREFWLSSHHEATCGPGFAVRGWYQTLYRDVLRGKKVLDIGSGMGIGSLEYARDGAQMTFVDIVEDNLAVIRRLCEIFGVHDARFLHLERLSSFDELDDDYDVVLCEGSQIHAPFEFVQRECAVILQHLKPLGRWIELAYPRERWVRDGQPPFRIWGTMTDGEGTPWAEWYDLDKLLRRLAPARFVPVLALNFHDDDFNWFDLVRAE